jgi:hypothetical protein
MLDPLTNCLWYAVGYVSWLVLERLFNEHFGQMESKYLFVPTIFFTLLGGISAVIATLVYLALEWDGKLTLTERISTMLAPKTYASITSGLSKMVKDLEAHVEKQDGLNVANEERKAEIDRQIAARQTEIAKSQKTAGKIRDLVEV